MSESKEKWQELCEQIIAERDPRRISELVALLNSELEKRESTREFAPQGQEASSKDDPGTPDVA